LERTRGSSTYFQKLFKSYRNPISLLDNVGQPVLKALSIVDLASGGTGCLEISLVI
jgi:hypothetical protein